MQAIRTHYIPATNYKGSRIKAQCERGSLVWSYEASYNPDEAHAQAAMALIARFCEEDLKQYGTPKYENPWARPFVSGGLPDGSCAHVFIPNP